METLPASIREKRLIRQYADIYLKSKVYIDEWLKNSKQDNLLETFVSQRIILATTLVRLIMGRPSNISKELSILIDSRHLQNSTQESIWAIIATFLTNEGNKSEAINIVKEHWGVPPVPDQVLIKVFDEFMAIPVDDEFEELLPYILEVFEYDTTDIETAIKDARKGLIPLKKKTKGIYYTPTDVVEFIARNTLGIYLDELLSIQTPDKILDSLKLLSIIDPSCGTGTFLRKCLRILLNVYENNNIDECPLATALQHNIYGVDKSTTAIESCILVLLTSNMKSLLNSKYSPITLWNLAALNIKSGDSTTGLLPDYKKQTELLKKLSQIRVRKKEGLLQQCYGYNSIKNQLQELIYQHAHTEINNGSFHYPLVFPEVFLYGGFTCVLGNPPYSSNPKGGNVNTSKYVSYGDNLYTLFVENMKYLSNNTKSVSGMVIPLSIAYHTGRHYKSLRKFIEDDSATWRFFHFDRSPDSLFGDDIKTRNCIIFRHTVDINKKKLYTSNLIRWNSKDRDKLFSNIPCIEIGSISIINYVPKVSHELELQVLDKLLNLRGNLSELIDKIPKAQLSNSKSTYNHCVYFYSTAYNWIPVFLDLPYSTNDKGESIITTSLWGVKCSSKEDALFIFACISSTISYWLWVLRGDGFHFSSQVLSQLPFHPSQFSTEAKSKLESLSTELWTEVVKHPISKVNSGKTIINYNFIACRTIIEKIDSLIIRNLDLPSNFSQFLKEWYLNMVQAGREQFKNAQFF
jgi:hypothetical protein